MIRSKEISDSGKFSKPSQLATKTLFISSLYFYCQVGVIDNNGTIDGLKDSSQPKVNSEFCFHYLLLNLIYDPKLFNLSF